MAKPVRRPNPMPASLPHGDAPGAPSRRGLLRTVLAEGGPGFCQFAVTNACNARCAFCNFAAGRLPRTSVRSVSPDDAFEALEILRRHGIRYLAITGGEPLLHPHLDAVVRCAAREGMKTILVTNGALLSPDRVRELADAGLSSFIVSIDAAAREPHERNRGLPGVCGTIRSANRRIRELGMCSTASVTMSRLVDYDALPDFLRSLGFRAATFSYPLDRLPSSFLGYADSELLRFTGAELLDAFERVRRMKKRFPVVNPSASLEEMQRFVRGEEQRFPCLGGFRHFYLDWNLDLWRCHFWDRPMCGIREFDESRRVRDGCTRCMIDCYRDAGVLQHVGISLYDAWSALRAGSVRRAAASLLRRGNWASVRAVLEQLPWLLRF